MRENLKYQETRKRGKHKKRKNKENRKRGKRGNNKKREKGELKGKKRDVNLVKNLHLRAF